MKRPGLKNILVLCMIAFSGISNPYAQDLRDLETWTSAEFRYRPTSNWRFGIEGQLRMKENSTEIDAYFTELTGGYQLLDNFWLIGGFRFIRRRNDASPSTDDENHIRLHADARYGHSIKRLNLNARLRYQTRDELGVSNAEGDFANHYVRLKLGAVYDFRSWKLDPQISTEVFHHSQKNEEYGFNKFRVSLGTEYSFNNWGKLGLFYRYEHEINAEEPRTTDIIRIQYVYTLKGY